MSIELAPYALSVSVLAMLLSIAALFYTRRNARAAIELRLTEREGKILDSFISTKVRTPFAHRLAIPKEREVEYNAKAVMLLHQINLYREVFENRDLVSKRRYEAYQNWANGILVPWVDSDDDLKRTFDLIVDSENTHDVLFINELKRLKLSTSLYGKT